MKVTSVIFAVISVSVLGVFGFAFLGFYDVSASSPHGGLVTWLLSTTSHASVERRAGEIDVPDLDDVALTLAGVNDFAGMCAGCHGAPGQEPEAMGQGMNPPPPDLADSAAHMTPAELFWVTKNGIKMTGMPAWGATHADEALWPVVAFMTRLPELDGAGYVALLADAQGHGHHATGDDAGGHEDAEADQHDHESVDANTEPDHVDPEHDEPQALTDEESHDEHDHEH
ncbi:MAG: cytochrome c [Gammaproteobacteria bacterium]|nr:cytochrome c [Gammaproteobacteria bacterium]